ncbi:ankyrin repeat domain-containing protein [Aspergillus mulundensis]|uniref:Uncharacterized protein n=1 Tax=Aspergillus mulundensis TaxID=1810919 RepID=A0A3D8QN43_9EURO|nr:hypothetical protein DSM5745_10354 [Aspergillus mulundensis]RDW63243.1 hypothetical protein DSM5745_10354 [Aspergillus mulundensis]
MAPFRLFDLPPELILAILEANGEPRDLASFIRTSRPAWNIGHPVLYSGSLEDKKEVFRWAAIHNQPGLVQWIQDDILPVLGQDAAYRDSLLEPASQSGCCLIVMLLLDNGAEPILSQKAVAADQVEVIQLMLARGANVEQFPPHYHHGHQVNLGKNTILHYAALCGAARIVNSLLSSNTVAGLDVNSTDFNGNTPLIKASHHNHPNTVAALLAHNADPHIVNSPRHESEWSIAFNPMTPLPFTAFDAAVLNHSPAVIKQLLDAGVNVNGTQIVSSLAKAITKYRDNWPLPHRREQATKSFHSTVRLLLDRGASIHPSGANKIATLHFAAEIDDMKVLQWILEHPDCDVNQKDLRGGVGLTPLCYATRSPNACRALIDAGASVEADGNLPLILATVRDHTEAVKILIKARPKDLDRTNNLGQTAVAVAAIRGRSEILEMLIKAGADLNKPDCVGEAPLGHAHKNKNGVCTLLRQAGARQGMPSGAYPKHLRALWDEINY